jgi:DNA-binding transcriptional MerR regulator
MASRAGQKGTLGLIIPEEDMPFTADGIRPDLIINPHAIPSRMTIGQLVECLLGKACTLYGGYGDCTAYATKGANYDTYGHMLTKMGYHNSGNQILYNGFTGAQLYSEIFIGPTYYMRLKHMVKDKINYRATGKRSALTRQTNQGRANDGGLRIGEMERDGIMAHGLSYFLNESYMIRGDEYYMAVCNKTGAIAVYNPERNLFLSPFSDGPLVFSNSKDGQPVLDALSIYGRSFSILRIPYALKLLIQELQVMNVQMRIITEENVDQLLNLSYQSQNIDKLLGIDHGEDGTVNRQIREIIDNYKKDTMDKVKQDNNMPMKQQQYVQEVPQELETGVNLKPPSPLYSPESSPINRNSPLYSPESSSESTEIYSVPVEKVRGYSLTPESEGEGEGLGIVSGIKEGISSLDSSLGEAAATVSNTVSGTIDNITNTLGSVSDALTGESQLEIFDDPQMNNIFNRLSADKKAAIIKMDDEKRQSVMRQIMAAAQAQQIQQSGGGLTSYFNGLPVQNQIAALQNTYKSMANEFKQLSGVVNAPQITIVKPQSAAEALYGGSLKLLAPEKNENTAKETDSMSGGSSLSSSSSSSSSSSDNSSQAGSGGIKIVKV